MTKKSDHPKILVVDDETAIQLVVERALLKDGYKVLIGNDGVEAYQLFKAHAPDLILLDIKMPEVDGFEFYKQLRTAQDGLTVPVIFISGMLEETDKLKGFELGAVDYITKPILVDEMLARVRLHLELRRKITELEVFNQAMLDREMRIIELKEEVNRLEKELGRTPPYIEVWKEEQ